MEKSLIGMNLQWAQNPNEHSMINKILGSIDELLLKKGKLYQDFLLSDPDSLALNSLSNQFLLILKPELFFSTNQPALRKVLETFFHIAKRQRVSLGRCAIFTGSYAREHRIFEANYPTLNSVARQGLRGCHKIALEKITLSFPKEAMDQRILGAFEFLKRCPSLTPKELSKINDEVGTIKIGSGIYLVNLIWDSVRYCILNAFFPYQLEHLTQNSATILAIEAFSERTWAELRKDFVGYINPSHATPYSLRRTFFEKKSELDLTLFDIARNGFHISPGPIEAVMQLENIFGSSCKSNLRASLIARGFSLKQIGSMEKNQAWKSDLPIFESTEDMNTDFFFDWVCEGRKKDILPLHLFQ